MVVFSVSIGAHYLHDILGIGQYTPATNKFRSVQTSGLAITETETEKNERAIFTFAQ